MALRWHEERLLVDAGDGATFSTTFGLSGAVFGSDRDRAVSVARAIRAGTISLNGGMWSAPDAPFGGYKQSGIGREMGPRRVRGVSRDHDHRRARPYGPRAGSRRVT